VSKVALRSSATFDTENKTIWLREVIFQLPFTWILGFLGWKWSNMGSIMAQKTAIFGVKMTQNHRKMVRSKKIDNQTPSKLFNKQYYIRFNKIIFVQDSIIFFFRVFSWTWSNTGVNFSLKRPFFGVKMTQKPSKNGPIKKNR